MFSVHVHVISVPMLIRASQLFATTKSRVDVKVPSLDLLKPLEDSLNEGTIVHPLTLTEWCHQQMAERKMDSQIHWDQLRLKVLH